MLLALIIILLLIQFVRRQRSVNKNRSFFVQHRLILAMLAMTILPIVILNFIIPKTYIETNEELIELGKESGNFLIIREAYERKIYAQPKNVGLRIEYVDVSEVYSSNDCEVALYTMDFKDNTTQILTESYIQLKCNSILENSYLEKLKSFPEVPFKNFLIGYSYALDGDSRCEKFLKHEIKINPNFRNSYTILTHYYYDKKLSKKLDAFISNPEYRAKIDIEFREYYQFSHGHIFEYAHTIYENRIITAKVIAILPALFISLIWLFYLWKIDVFNPEKWYHLVFVFCLGTIFTFFCLPLYDIARYIFHFGLNGSAINDFFYSFFVIGGSEELVKFIPWFLFALISKRLKEPYDYILYSSVASLGFAFAENWMYLEHSNHIATRGLISTVSHMFDASIIAYSFILYRFKYKEKKWSFLLPIAGFIAAALSHGFYDFWIISSSAKDFTFVTIIFFVISLHIWFYFKNNAINHSSYYQPSIQLNTLVLQDIVTLSIIGLFMVEYITMSFIYGAVNGNQSLYNHASIVALFIIYFNFQVEQLKVERGIWKRLKFQLPHFFSSMFPFLNFRLKSSRKSVVESSILGKSFTFYTTKSNQYIGNQLPISGRITHSIVVDGKEDWYAVELNNDLIYSNYVRNCVLIHVFDSNQSLNQDKVEVIFLLVPTMEILKNSDLRMRDFRYTGKVFSRPKHSIF